MKLNYQALIFNMSSKNLDNLNFTEEQKFTQWWLWVLLIGITLIPVYGCYKQLVLGEPMGSKPLPNIGMVLFLLFMLGFLFLFWMLRLKTVIDNEGIKMTFSPLSKKEIKWEEIKTAEVLNYGFVGGWGVRMGTKFGTVYNTRGNMGLALVLKNGKKFCIGTQQPEELSAVLNEVKESGII